MITFWCVVEPFEQKSPQPRTESFCVGVGMFEGALDQS